MSSKQNNDLPPNLELLLRDVNHGIVNGFSIRENDVIVILNHICVVRSLSYSKARMPKLHILGLDIFTEKQYETLCVNSDIFIKIFPFKCNLKIYSINKDNTCNLQFLNNTIDNVIIPPKFIKQIVDNYNQGLEIVVSIDSYFETLCHIKDYNDGLKVTVHVNDYW